MLLETCTESDVRNTLRQMTHSLVELVTKGQACNTRRQQIHGLVDARVGIIKKHFEVLQETVEASADPQIRAVFNETWHAHVRVDNNEISCQR